MSADSSPPLYLLLLPPPPYPPEAANLKAAYDAPLTALLKQLALERRSEPTGSILEIAVPARPLGGNGTKSRVALYSQIQQLFAGIYKLICIIAAREDINVEDVKGVDVKLLMLAYPGDESEDIASPTPTGSLVNSIVSLRVLSGCQRPWAAVIGVESEEGEKLLRDFLISQDGRMKVRRVPGGVVQVSKDPADIPEYSGASEARRHTSVAVGGTFDHLHIGHKLLLTMLAFLLTEGGDAEHSKKSLAVCVTGDELLKNKKFAEVLESWEDRQKNAMAFMRAIIDFRPLSDAPVKTATKSDPGPNGYVVEYELGEGVVVKCMVLSDPFGPTITDKEISALVISAETRSGGQAINEKRREKNWPELDVFEVDVLDAREEEGTSAEDPFQAKLSSTAIRKTIYERQQNQKSLLNENQQPQ